MKDAIIGQTLYAINDIEVEVTNVRTEIVKHVRAIRKSDGFVYHFQLIDGVQMHYKYDSWDEDSSGAYKPSAFFREKIK
jgi:hypothetical protein